MGWGSEKSEGQVCRCCPTVYSPYPQEVWSAARGLLSNVLMYEALLSIWWLSCRGTKKKPSLHVTLLCAVGFYWTLFKKHMGFSQITDRPKQLWNCRLSGRLEKHLWVKWNFFCLQAQVNVAQIVSVNNLQWAWMPWSSVRSDPSFQVAVCASRSSQLELGQCEPKQKVKKNKSGKCKQWASLSQLHSHYYGHEGLPMEYGMVVFSH